MQNKLHYTVTGMTTAELITHRANAARPNMGLNTWKGAAVAKSDVTVAKNYLHEDEITELNRIVVRARFCRRPGAAPQADLPARLEDTAGRLPAVQRP